MGKHISLDNIKKPPLCPSCKQEISKVETVSLKPQALDNRKTLHVAAACCPHCHVALSWSLEVAILRDTPKIEVAN